MKDISNLKYILIPGKFPKDEQLQKIHNKAYIFWKEFWNGVLKDNGTDHTVTADNFWRQDIVSMIMNEEEVVGLHLYSFFNMNSLAAKDHTYMANSFNSEYFKKLNDYKAQTLMSIEYLSVAPGWRKKETGISLSAVLLTLACKYQENLKLDALIAPSRSDNKVTDSIVELGGDVLVGGLEMHNTPVDLIAFFRNRPHFHPNKDINNLAQKLWNAKIDYTGTFNEEIRKLKISA